MVNNMNRRIPGENLGPREDLADLLGQLGYAERSYRAQIEADQPKIAAAEAAIAAARKAIDVLMHQQRDLRGEVDWLRYDVCHGLKRGDFDVNSVDSLLISGLLIAEGDLARARDWSTKAAEVKQTLETNDAPFLMVYGEIGGRLPRKFILGVPADDPVHLIGLGSSKVDGVIKTSRAVSISEYDGNLKLSTTESTKEIVVSLNNLVSNRSGARLFVGDEISHKFEQLSYRWAFYETEGRLTTDALFYLWAATKMTGCEHLIPVHVTRGIVPKWKSKYLQSVADTTAWGILNGRINKPQDPLAAFYDLSDLFSYTPDDVEAVHRRIMSELKRRPDKVYPEDIERLDKYMITFIRDKLRIIPEVDTTGSDN